MTKGLINGIINDPESNQIWIRIETNIIQFLAVPIPGFTSTAGFYTRAANVSS